MDIEREKMFGFERPKLILKCFPLPCRAFIACSISARSPEGLVEVTGLTSSKATSFWWAIICFNCVKMTKGICSFEVLKMQENNDLCTF